MVEPFHDENYDNRKGFYDGFLGIRLRMPAVLDEIIVSKLDDGSHVIPYEHFSLVMHRKRRLVLFAATNIDGRPSKREPEPGRKYTRKSLARMGVNDREKWFTDERIPTKHQLPDKFFTKDHKAFDKGHIVRRDDVTWGDSYAEVERANGDTFHVTNCSPQVASFNRSNLRGIWGKLENCCGSKREPTAEFCFYLGARSFRGRIGVRRRERVEEPDDLHTRFRAHGPIDRVS